jgi:YHS domain-containing protein
MNTNAQGVLLNGYDVVAYFNANEAIVGAPQHATSHGGARLHFASDENLQAFKSDSEKYMPKFGGYCAFAVANGKGGVPANPKTFKIYHGELLMFFDDLYEGKRFNSSVAWNADERSLYDKAQANWPALRA